jgi:hypothetical protein
LDERRPGAGESGPISCSGVWRDTLSNATGFAQKRVQHAGHKRYRGQRSRRDETRPVERRSKTVAPESGLIETAPDRGSTGIIQCFGVCPTRLIRCRPFRPGRNSCAVVSAYRQSLAEQLPNARRTHEPYAGSKPAIPLRCRDGLLPSTIRNSDSVQRRCTNRRCSTALTRLRRIHRRPGVGRRLAVLGITVNVGRGS